ncbi:hypothetical protein MKW94_024015 [Papaver nudicaule]|uniref:EGF-like calcium-binding domain-containing protein n=1 Tax=Papaver nudicaule TaxID=74823 RepID=A0AA41S8P8_PAPNU|nr:hypothetical protein [Papaver nudicaule]
MRVKLGFCLLVLILGISSCLGKFVVEKNSLRVFMNYGGTLVGTVVYPKANQKACKHFNEVSLSFKSKPGGLPTFLLVDRGDCFFTLKALSAQNDGAAAILVADDKDEPLITMDTSAEENANADYLLNISIPSALVSKTFGDTINRAPSNGEMRVEYELWSNSNDECGPKCDSKIEFLRNIKGAAQVLEQKGYHQFTPHYITWFCPESYLLSKQCNSQCINHGRYCAPDPEQDFSKGYDGKDVVVQILRQYVADFAIRCPMKEQKYTNECADQVILSLGLDLKKIDECIGDPRQSYTQSRARCTGKLDKAAVLKAICSGFQETTEPSVCLSEDIQTNECLVNNGKCWQDKAANVTACKFSFLIFSFYKFICRTLFGGRVCECPVVQGVKLSGDSYTHCADTDECKVTSACKCPHCKDCKNTWGSYECSCSDIKEARSVGSWNLVWVTFLALAAAGAGGFLVYKYRIRIRAITTQYMPSDSQVGERETHQNLLSHGNVRVPKKVKRLQYFNRSFHHICLPPDLPSSFFLLDVIVNMSSILC